MAAFIRDHGATASSAHAKRPPRERGPFRMATPTGLEPATSAVTGRRANQLRYGALTV